ncbi:ABC transporter ATP-binding protein [bacterium]|nr:ABC transporter ATP-binding protein [bacterium]
MENDTVVECQGLTKVYHRRNGAPVKAVDNVDLQVTTGEFVVIVGRSGSGKSTLLSLLGGLDRPTSGSVRLRGNALDATPDRELTRIRRENVGFVFQDFNLLPAYTALQNVEVALAPACLSKQERRERVEALLGRFDVLRRSAHLPAELSLGEQQRVAVARALANRPPLILADEPTGGVDPVTGKEVVDKLIELNRQDGVAVVVTTHGVFPLDAASRVLFMKDGAFVSREAAGLMG